MQFEPGMNEPAAIKRYKTQIQELLFEAPQGDHSGTFDNLRKRLKIDFAVHKELYEKIRSNLNMSEHLKAFRIEFNENVQDSFAGHDTRLVFRFSNLSATERFYKVALFWDDKETTDDMDFRAQNDSTVKPKDIIEIGSTHVFIRPGHKEIKGLEITIESAALEVAKFRVETFHVRVGNPEQRIYNNITTNTHITGKVVDATGVAANSGERMDYPDNKSPIWRNLNFVFLAPEEDEAYEIETIRKLSSSSMLANKAALEPVSQPTLEPKLERAAFASLAVTRHLEPLQVVSPSVDTLSLRDAVERMLEMLLRLSSLASSLSSKGVFSAMDFSLDLLEILHYQTPETEMDAIVGIVFENPSGVTKDEEQFVTDFSQAASIITLSGITVVTKGGNTIVRQATYTWGQLLVNNCGFYRQRFGQGSYLVSFGDKSANRNFAGLRFDLRRYKGTDSVDALYSEAEALFRRITDMAVPYIAAEEVEDLDKVEAIEEVEDLDKVEAIEDLEEVEEEYNDAHAEAVFERVVDMALSHSIAGCEVNEYQGNIKDVLNPEVEAARLLAMARFTERENYLLNFVKLFAFVAQQCDETLPRSVFVAQDIASDLWSTLHLNFSFGMLALCVEPNQTILKPDGKLASWNGYATALTGHGIYHLVAMDSAGAQQYKTDGKSCFLSWEKFFFEINADLIVRDAGPDLWIGTSEKFLIRGSYCDYSTNILQWDYFEDFVKKDLLETFSKFKSFK